MTSGAGIRALAIRVVSPSRAVAERQEQQLLLQGWVKALAPVMFPDASGFSLDFLPALDLPGRATNDGADDDTLSADAALVTYRARSRDRGANGLYQADVTSGWSRRDARWVNTFYRETPTPPEQPAAAE